MNRMRRLPVAVLLDDLGAEISTASVGVNWMRLNLRHGFGELLDEGLARPARAQRMAAGEEGIRISR